MAAAEMNPRSVTVAVVDSGWDRFKKDDRVGGGISFVGPTPFIPRFGHDDHDRIGHGTACILRILKIAPNARVIPIRIFAREVNASLEQLISALEFVNELRPEIVSLSLATHRREAIAPLYSLCAAITARGTAIIAAAAKGDEWSYPAVFDNVIGVRGGQRPALNSIAYDQDNAIECTAYGGLSPRVALKTDHSNSLAAATVTGIVALEFGSMTSTGNVAAREALRRLSGRERSMPD